VPTEQLKLSNSQARYYLLYCAVNSQLKHNEGALVAARKANQILRNNSQLLHRLASLARTPIDPLTVSLLAELSHLQNSAENFQL
jgi:hypothetical protein